jgi:spermidine synthase
MTAKHIRHRAVPVALTIAVAEVFSLWHFAAVAQNRNTFQAAATKAFGAVEAEEQSDFGLVRVRKKGSIRTMLFVHSSGKEVGETMLNLRKPHELMIPYTRTMFASLLFQPRQARVLIVGAGGGAMVHFLKYHLPDTKVDAVEIDPTVVKFADEYFETRTEENVRVITADGLKFIQQITEPYDVIYMDAFLKPSTETDDTGRPLTLKTIEFYKKLQQKLADDGVVAFNINLHAEVQADIATLREAFPQLYLFRISSNEEVVAIATRSQTRTPISSLRRTARAADRKYRKNFSFQSMLKSLVTK